MADNILKKSLDVTSEEFLAEIYGSKSRPEWRALTTLFGEILTGRSTLVSEGMEVERVSGIVYGNPRENFEIRSAKILVG